MRVVRAGRGFRVILHAEQRQIAVAQAFERVVVQIDVGEFDFAVRERIGVDGEVVIVCRDLDLPRLQLLYRMIPAMVAELQLESFAAQRDASELMSQANSEDRHSPYQAADRIDSISTRLRIAWAIRQENSVGLQRQHIFRGSLRWR